VQIKIDRIDRHLLRQFRDQFGGDALEGIARDHAARAAAGPKQRNDVVIGGHNLEKAGQRKGNAAQPFQHVVTTDQRRPVAMAAE